MKMKRLLPVVFTLGFLAICLFLSGCGKNGGGGGGDTTIRGQVVINNVPVSPDQVSHVVLANNKIYMGNVIAENGYFSHGSGELDFEYCIPGCTVTLVFMANESATGTFKETCVYEYTVQKGDNNLGKIDLGLHGFSLVSPEDNAEIGPEPWPPEFQWTAYGRTGITPEYCLNLICDVLVKIEKTTQDTSLILDGDEKVTFLGFEYDLSKVRGWGVHVAYQEGNHTIRHYSDIRNIEIILPEE